MAAYCTNCAAALDPGAKFCPSCGAQTEAAAPPPAPSVSPTHDAGSSPYAPPALGRRYPALRIVAIVLKVGAVIWVVIGVIGLLVVIASSSNSPLGSRLVNPVQGFALLLVCLYFAVMSWAGSELLHVFMDIEENTRRAATK